MNAQPLTIKAANALVADWHRHHKPVVGALFAIGMEHEGQLVGAAIVGRPVARMLQDGRTAEVVRCVTDGTKNACSALYAACWRAWRAMGGTRLVTYTLATEPGTSVKAAGWREVHRTRATAQGWSRPSRPRSSGPQVAKTLWETGARRDGPHWPAARQGSRRFVADERSAALAGPAQEVSP